MVLYGYAEFNLLLLDFVRAPYCSNKFAPA